MTRPTLWATRGLPGSGKTTWARRQQAERPDTVLISKDETRAMLHGGRWTKGNEKQVVAVRDAVVVDALTRGRDVIVHDTNFHPPHIDALQVIAAAHQATFRVQDFTDVDVDTCVARDAARQNPVGAAIIRTMWRRYVHVAPGPAERNAGPDVVICDLDGTLAILGDRSPYDTTARVMDDGLNPVVARILALESAAGTPVVLMSGREDLVRGPTEAWLSTHGVAWERLHMRPSGDRRKDSVVKRELFDEHVAGRMNVRYVIDDRPQVVRMWRDELGLFVLDVNQSGEEF